MFNAESSFAKVNWDLAHQSNKANCAERILNKTVKTFNETFVALKCMLNGYVNISFNKILD